MTMTMYQLITKAEAFPCIDIEEGAPLAKDETAGTHTIGIRMIEDCPELPTFRERYTEAIEKGKPLTVYDEATCSTYSLHPNALINLIENEIEIADGAEYPTFEELLTIAKEHI